MMQDRTFRGQSADGVWHEGFLIRSPGVKNSRPGEGWYINSEKEPAYAHLVKPFTIGIKNDLFGEKRVAVEVFPTQDRLVDVCDCYHLWVFEKGFQLPFGIHPRDKKTVTVNRGSTRVRAIDGAGREHSIKELLEENGAADVPKQAYAQAMAGYMMKNLLGG